MPTNETRPAIGTAEAAVQSCVRLIASVAGQPEALVAYWLDLYWQVRNIYERENAPEPDPQVITRADLYPVMRELMQDALKSAAGDGPPRASRAGIAAQADESAPSSESTLSGFSPVKIEPDRGGWKRKKAAIRDRLVSARAEGMTIPQLVEASGGKLEDEDVFGILNAAKVDMETYRRLEAALEALGR